MISFKNVSYIIKNKYILNNITFHIKCQEKVLIMGESGCGKSTLLNLIMKNISPSSGNIYFNKKDINKLSYIEELAYRKNKIIYLTQKDDLFDDLTVMENLCLFYLKNDCINVLKKAHLLNLKSRYIYSLSGGERQKVAIIKACLSSCDVLLCDEITSALDVISANKIINFIFEMFSDSTIIFVSHDKSIFKDKINHFIYLENGKIKSESISENNNILVKNKRKRKSKNNFSLFLFEGIKKITIPSFLIFISLIICFFITFSFQDIFTFIAKKSYENYYDYQLLLVKDYKDFYVDNQNTFYTLNDFFLSSKTIINGKGRNQIVFSPFYNEDENKRLVCNQKILNLLNIDMINSIEICNNDFYYKDDSVEKVIENGMFVKACIYYNINYFSHVIKQKDNQICIVNHDFTKYDERFTNNPLFMEKKEDKPYLESNAYLDYLTYQMVFDSIKMIVSYYFIIVLIIAIITSYLITLFHLTKDMKKIAIFISLGYNDFYIVFSYILPYFIFIIPLLCISIFIIDLLAYSFLSFFIQMIMVTITYQSFKKKKLNDLLKEETLL